MMPCTKRMNGIAKFAREDFAANTLPNGETLMLRFYLYIIIFSLPIIGFAENFIAGKDYEIINNTSTYELANQNTSCNKQIKVVEFFYYGCHWCYLLEPQLMQWVKEQKKIKFSRVAVIFNKDWLYYAKAYYLAALIGQDKKLSRNLFQAIQVKKQVLNNNQAMINFFIANGIDQEIAKNAFENSTTIEMQISNSHILMSQFIIKGVPAIIINNQFKVDLQMTRGMENFFKVLDFLITKIEQENNTCDS